MSEPTTTDSIELVETEGTGAGVHEGMAVDADGNALTEDQIGTLAEPESPAAEAEPVDNSTESEKVESASNVDPDLIKWAEKKGGFDTTDLSPGAIRALEIARQTEREYHKGQVEKSNLQQSLQTQQPVYQPVPVDPEQMLYDYNGNPVAPPSPRLDPDLQLLKFQVAHKDFEQGGPLDQEMGKIVSSDPQFWATNLDKAYLIAKANLSEGTTEARIEAARREERERLTRKSTLSQPQSQATAPAPSSSIRTAAEAERFIASASKSDYNAKLPELERVLGIELRPRN